MSTSDIAVEVLLGFVVALTLFCSFGVLIMRNALERMHYMAPVSTVATLALVLAVAIQEGWGQATIKVSLIAVTLYFTNAVLAHITARAARVRQYGNWVPKDEEKVEGMESAG